MKICKNWLKLITTHKLVDNNAVLFISDNSYSLNKYNAENRLWKQNQLYNKCLRDFYLYLPAGENINFVKMN